MYFKYFLLVLISLLASFLNYFLAPLVVLFASDAGWLPRWLSWFQTPDNSLDGDDGWKTEHRPYKAQDTKFQRWVNRFCWLYRNSMYGFAIDVLGLKVQPTDTLIIQGDPKVSNRPLCEGVVHRKLLRDGQLIGFQWYGVFGWSQKYCLRINLGWKLWGDHNQPRSCQLTFSPNPFMSYSL